VVEIAGNDGDQAFEWLPGTGVANGSEGLIRRSGAERWVRGGLLSGNAWKVWLLGLVFVAGLVAGSESERYALNWWGESGEWNMSVQDRYELRIGRPAVPGRPAPSDVNPRILMSVGGTGLMNHPLDADIHLVPYLFSDSAGEPGVEEEDVRPLFRERPAVHSNDYGEVNIEGVHGAFGRSLSADRYEPPRLGATFMIGDGRNAQGGVTFYEFRVSRGRIWSEGELYRYDCAASGLYRTCRAAHLRGAADVGSVQHSNAPLGRSTPAGAVIEGTEVFGYLTIP
jgi:hypothetical protein